MRRSRGVKPFGFFILERQSATIRVSNPNGIAAGVPKSDPWSSPSDWGR